MTSVPSQGRKIFRPAASPCQRPGFFERKGEKFFAPTSVLDCQLVDSQEI
jgi:hypothetical protein